MNKFVGLALITGILVAATVPADAQGFRDRLRAKMNSNTQSQNSASATYPVSTAASGQQYFMNAQGLQTFLPSMVGGSQVQVFNGIDGSQWYVDKNGTRQTVPPPGQQALGAAPPSPPAQQQTNPTAQSQRPMIMPVPIPMGMPYAGYPQTQPGLTINGNPTYAPVIVPAGAVPTTTTAAPTTNPTTMPAYPTTSYPTANPAAYPSATTSHPTTTYPTANPAAYPSAATSHPTTTYPTANSAAYPSSHPTSGAYPAASQAGQTQHPMNSRWARRNGMNAAASPAPSAAFPAAAAHQATPASSGRFNRFAKPAAAPVTAAAGQTPAAMEAKTKAHRRFR